MEHIDWIDTDNIILANSSRDLNYKKMTTDIQDNKIDKVRLLKNSNKSYFRYYVDNKCSWFYLSNDESRNGTYYTHIYSIQDDELNELNIVYKQFDREDKLNQLLS
jgi:hypothetical protein